MTLRVCSSALMQTECICYVSKITHYLKLLNIWLEETSRGSNKMKEKYLIKFIFVAFAETITK